MYNTIFVQNLNNKKVLSDLLVFLSLYDGYEFFVWEQGVNGEIHKAEGVNDGGKVENGCYRLMYKTDVTNFTHELLILSESGQYKISSKSTFTWVT